MVRSHGEAILVLGTRKAESSGRSHRMTALKPKRSRDLLSPNESLPNCLVYSPVENWSNDDVWTFLCSANPWGYSNKDLLTMYQGASPDGECPLVVDSTTPSCGDSRFGCWTCTLVDKDKSMSAMIQNDDEKEWMLPLLELRNDLDVADDRHLRDFRRMNGPVQLFPRQANSGSRIRRNHASAGSRSSLRPRHGSARTAPTTCGRSNWSRWRSWKRSAAYGSLRSTNSKTTFPDLSHPRSARTTRAPLDEHLPARI